MSIKEGDPSQDSPGMDMFGLDPTDQDDVNIWIAEITSPEGETVAENPYERDRFEIGPDRTIS